MGKKSRKQHKTSICATLQLTENDMKRKCSESFEKSSKKVTEGERRKSNHVSLIQSHLNDQLSHWSGE
jgi:hypothetical protein